MSAKSRKSRRTKALAGVVALAAGFAGALLEPSMALAELCGGKDSSGCNSLGASGSHTGNSGPGTSDNDTPAPPSS
jgi:hypothetical protein